MTEPVPDESRSTGQPAVDAAVEALDRAAELPPEQQVSAYEEAHKALSQTLSAIDEG